MNKKAALATTTDPPTRQAPGVKKKKKSLDFSQKLMDSSNCQKKNSCTI